MLPLLPWSDGTIFNYFSTNVIQSFKHSNTCVASVATPIRQGSHVLFYRKEIPDGKACKGQILEMVIYYGKQQLIIKLLWIISDNEDLHLVCPYLYWLGWKFRRRVRRSLQSVMDMVGAKLPEDYIFTWNKQVQTVCWRFTFPLRPLIASPAVIV